MIVTWLATLALWMLVSIRRSPTVDEARAGLKTLLDIDDIQADAILSMQLRRLAALEQGHAKGPTP